MQNAHRHLAIPSWNNLVLRRYTRRRRRLVDERANYWCPLTNTLRHEHRSAPDVFSFYHKLMRDAGGSPATSRDQPLCQGRVIAVRLPRAARRRREGIPGEWTCRRRSRTRGRAVCVATDADRLGALKDGQFKNNGVDPQTRSIATARHDEAVVDVLGATGIRWTGTSQASTACRGSWPAFGLQTNNCAMPGLRA